MTNKPLIALSAAALVLSLAGQAHALTLTNRDTVEQRVQINEGGDEAVTRDVVLGADQTLDGLCEDGCTIALENGVQESFEGDEAVSIENGRFMIAE
ncbi:MAG: hypothetical protein OEU56_19890 [Rhodospirillales bacterium]|nr:hypothetical protein [Rhodospirillales bacterium]